MRNTWWNGEKSISLEQQGSDKEHLAKPEAVVTPVAPGPVAEGAPVVPGAAVDPPGGGVREAGGGPVVDPPRTCPGVLPAPPPPG